MDCKLDKELTQKIIINPNDINAIKLHNDLTSIKQVKSSAQEEYTKFVEKLKIFDSVKSVDEAKSIAKSILPINNEINYLYVGEAKCAIISRRNLLRIVLKSDNKIICYNFRAEETQDDRH